MSWLRKWIWSKQSKLDSMSGLFCTHFPTGKRLSPLRCRVESSRNGENTTGKPNPCGRFCFWKRGYGLSSQRSELSMGNYFRNYHPAYHNRCLDPSVCLDRNTLYNLPNYHITAHCPPRLDWETAKWDLDQWYACSESDAGDMATAHGSRKYFSRKCGNSRNWDHHDWNFQPAEGCGHH